MQCFHFSVLSPIMSGGTVFNHQKIKKMNEIKHTPGPWYFTENAIIANNGGTFITENPAVKWELLASLTKNAGNRELRENIKQANANARLMASAPELLSVLQFFVGIVETLPDSDESDLRFSDLYFKAKNAIAKARGEA